MMQRSEWVWLVNLGLKLNQTRVCPKFPDLGLGWLSQWWLTQHLKAGWPASCVWGWRTKRLEVQRSGSTLSDMSEACRTCRAAVEYHVQWVTKWTLSPWRTLWSWEIKQQKGKRKTKQVVINQTSDSTLLLPLSWNFGWQPGPVSTASNQQTLAMCFKKTQGLAHFWFIN